MAESRQQLIERLRAERDPAVLGEYIRHPAWEVRWAATESLGASGFPAATAILLDAQAHPRQRNDVPMINAALGMLGSHATAAIPALTALIHAPVEDVKTSAIHALMEIGDASVTPVYLDALTDRSWVAKWYAMHALARHGDERAIDPVCERVRAALARDRKTNYGDTSEVGHALRFLARWRGEERIERTIAWVRDRAFDRLLPAERVFFVTTFSE